MARWTYAKDVIGEFTEKDTGNVFEYSRLEEPVLAPPAHGGRNTEFSHKVWVGGRVNDQGWRAARVGKTVVHIITDEDDCGRAVVEKWYIKQHREYA
jgi:hypothetical protein